MVKNQVESSNTPLAHKTQHNSANIRAYCTFGSYREPHPARQVERIYLLNLGFLTRFEIPVRWNRICTLEKRWNSIRGYVGRVDIMEKILRNYLNSLGDKYRAEADLHEDISRKIWDRLDSFMLTPQEFARLERAILCHVEETYKRLLTTKRHFRQARKMLARSHQMTQQNLEKLMQIKTSVQQIKDLLESPKGSLPILVIKKKPQPSAPRRELADQVITPKPQKSDIKPFPHGLCHN